MTKHVEGHGLFSNTIFEFGATDETTLKLQLG
jgi:hypothetical protein